MLCGHNTLPYHADSLVNGVVRLSALTDNIFIKTLINVHILICDSPPPEKCFGAYKGNPLYMYWCSVK